MAGEEQDDQAPGLGGAAANDPPPEELLRETADRQRAFDLALALQAEGIRHRLERPEGEGGAWRLWVRGGEGPEAERALAEFEAENGPPQAAPEAPPHPTVAVGLLFAVLCVAGQLATGPRDAHVLWFARGSADAARILGGEWWRCLTAITLHADLQHALGNAASGWLLLDSVARRIGGGRAALLALLAGAASNALTANVARASFESIGGSTAVFGALGAATALQAFLRVRRGWLVVGAGLALLGWLGTGEHADLFGHLFGFAVGALLGALAVPLARRPGGPAWAQASLAGGALALLVGAWALALRTR